MEFRVKKSAGIGSKGLKNLWADHHDSNLKGLIITSLAGGTGVSGSFTGRKTTLSLRTLC
jgi:hypothetical protein